MAKPSKRRSEFLHLIYFFDGGKTRTLKIPTHLIKVACISFPLLLLWTVFASVFLMKSSSENERLSQHLQASLETIFQYEVKQDALLDKVYASKKVESKNPKAIPQNQASPSNLVNKVEEKVNVSNLNLLDLKQLNVLSDNKDSEVSLETPILVRSESQLELSIALRNRKQSRSQGYIWAKAEWKDAQGNIQTYISPEPSPGQDKPVPSSASTFNIKMYKVAKFTFPIPVKDAKLSKLELWLSDRSSQSKSRFELVNGEPTLAYKHL